MISLPPLFFSIARNPITAVGLPLLGGMLSGSPTRRVVKGQWYNSLAFPPGQAPSQAFPIVWSVLYTGIGYASYIAVQEYDGYALESTRSAIATGLTVYYAQLGLNFAWTSFFFVKKWLGVALVDSISMFAASTYMTVVLHRATQGKTTYFLAPYCAWLGYATYINGYIWFWNVGKRIPRD